MSTLDELRDIIHDKYNLDPAILDANVSVRDFGLDSLALAELLFEIEDRLAITLPNNDAGIDTLAGLAALVDRVRAPMAVG